MISCRAAAQPAAVHLLGPCTSGCGFHTPSARSANLPTAAAARAQRQRTAARARLPYWRQPTAPAILPTASRMAVLRVCVWLLVGPHWPQPFVRACVHWRHWLCSARIGSDRGGGELTVLTVHSGIRLYDFGSWLLQLTRDRRDVPRTACPSRALRTFSAWWRN
jgi:hypothetical protein